MLQANPAELADRLSQETGRKIIAARDGMTLAVDEMLGGSERYPVANPIGFLNQERRNPWVPAPTRSEWILTFAIGFIAAISPFLFMQLLPTLLNRHAPGSAQLSGDCPDWYFNRRHHFHPLRQPVRKKGAAGYILLCPGDPRHSDRYGEQPKHGIQGGEQNIGCEGELNQCGSESAQLQTAPGEPIRLTPPSANSRESISGYGLG